MTTTIIILGVIGALALLFLFLGQPLWSLLNVPRQALFLWQGSAARRNHAIEHATVNVLEERYGTVALDGYSTSEGFRIRGPIDPAMLLDAAREGLLRLQRGDRALAVHVRCATTLTASHLVMSSLLIASLVVAEVASIFNIALSLLIAVALAPKLSRWLQRWIITSMDVKGMSIGAIELVQPRLVLGVMLAGGAEFAVRTKPARRVYHTPYRYGEHVFVPVEARSKQR